MSVIFFLLPLALVLAAVAVGAFVWATRSGQFDDLETPGLRVLHEDPTDVTVRKCPPHPPGSAGQESVRKDPRTARH